MPIIVDPYLIVVPDETTTNPDTIREYAKRFSTWEKEFAKKDGNYFVSLGAYSAIQQAGRVPTIENLTQLFKTFAIDEYSVKDIVSDCSTFLANCEYLENIQEVSDAYAEIEQLSGSESVIPEEMRQRLAQPVAEAFVASLIYAGYALNAQQAADKWSIATAPTKTVQPPPNLHTSSTIRRVDSDSGEVVEANFRREWPLLIEPYYLYATYDVDEYRECPEIATLIIWSKLKVENSTAQSIDSKTYSFGRNFVKSITDARVLRRPNSSEDIERVYLRIVEVLQGLPFGSDIHHVLRKSIRSRTAEVQKRERPNSSGVKEFDIAARVEVCGGPTPLRLHYWRCFDGSYEFSNVTTIHDDPTIYY